MLANDYNRLQHHLHLRNRRLRKVSRLLDELRDQLSFERRERDLERSAYQIAARVAEYANSLVWEDATAASSELHNRDGCVAGPGSESDIEEDDQSAGPE